MISRKLSKKSRPRTCYTNFRTEAEDVDVLFEVIEELGAKIHA